MPRLVTQQNRFIRIPLITGCLYFFYWFTNHYPLFKPRLLPFTDVDSLAPFWPLSVWVYLSDIALVAVGFILIRDEKNLNRFILVYTCMWLTSCIIFWVHPTYYPRELFPLPNDSSTIDPITLATFKLLRIIDSPNNCCPSIHISTVFTTTFAFLYEQRRKFPIFFIWSLLVAVSVLTTKQHYFIDVLGGFATAVLAQLVIHKFEAKD